MLIVRGMGQALPSIQSSMLGFKVDCASPLQYYASPLCWWKSLDDWTAGNQAATQAAVAAAGPMPYMLPAGPATIQQETLPGAFTPDQAIVAGNLANTSALQDYFAKVQANLQNLTANPPANPPATDWSWLWIVGGILAGLVVLKEVIR